MNDWKFSQFIKFVLLIQVLILAIVGLELNNINIPILSQFVTFLYLTFIPGFLILRILKLHKLGNIETILYAVGLSILSLMLIGFIMTIFCPLIGISKPITLFYLVITISLYVLALCVLSYLRDRNFHELHFIDINEYFSSKFLFLCLLPFLAILGSYALNFYNNNLISMMLFVFIGLTLVLVIFDKIPGKLYSFTVWIIAISLVYVSSLVSPYVWGWDIQNEYYLANIVIQSSYWNFSLQDAYNAMLSIVMVAPIYSIFTNISLDYVFKIIYPFLFSLVPLGLYKIFKIQTSPKIAFAAVFLFMSFNTFYIELLSLAREMTAELFLVSMLLLIFSKKVNMSSIILFIIFGMGLIVSHYSVTYFFIFTLLCVSLILILFQFPEMISDLNKKSYILLNFQNLKYAALNVFILGVLMLFTYLWYTNIAFGYASAGIIGVFQAVNVDFLQKIYLLMLKFGIIQNIYLILAILLVLGIVAVILFRKNRMTLNVKIRENPLIHFIDHIANFIESKINYKIIAVLSIIILIGLFFLIGPPKTWIVSVLRYLNYTTVFFALAGFLFSFIYFSKNKIQKEYFAFSTITIIMLFAGIFLPSFEVTFNITRIYEISFMFLAPFCIIGGILIVKSILKALNNFKVDDTKDLKIFSIFLVIFMLFNTGFVSVISGQSIPMHLTAQNGQSDYYPRFDQSESMGAKWLVENKVDTSIYADVYGVFAFYRYIYSPILPSAYNNVYLISDNNDLHSYTFLRKLNKDNNILIGFTSRTNRNRVYADMGHIINPKNLIYENGASKIYFS
ncbi:MAG: DUF2206 domain-containing protein [Methanobacterium sp.]|uniref:DUF2206 domain-containing protein n=1 Tax=Methanobacterium sp. TaxID=2164 RepID=UPI003D65292A|nr:DUF2206 domain-containing protein [Methanobacterium sp.]